MTGEPQAAAGASPEAGPSPESAHVYRVIEVVGSSPDGVEAAIRNAITQTAQSIDTLDWFEIREIQIGRAHV